MGTVQTGSRGLVLAGGGVSGIAWELGVITALQRAGIDLRQADVVVGTSAGSVVGVQLTGGTSLDDVINEQLLPAHQSSERAAGLDYTHFVQMVMDQFQKHGMNPQAIRAGIGEEAQKAKTPSAEDRLAIIAARLPTQDWPAQKLLITAVDAENGEFVVFDRDSGVSLVEAVAASCAVPLVWPPVRINGRLYIDGGMRSGTNADLASGTDRVVILVPMTQAANEPSILGSNLQEERAQLERQGSRVMVISADEQSIAAMGPNILDPAYRADSARAGLRQGEELAEKLGVFWS